MSSGKRLAKRSILGTRVAACRMDGLYHTAVICGTRTLADRGITVYSVRFTDAGGGGGGGVYGRSLVELPAASIIGPGFRAVSDVLLPSGQRVHVTHNGREVSARVVEHTDAARDDVLIELYTEAGPMELKKKLDEIRLWQSRKSPRLVDFDTDFARLADVGVEKRRSPSLDIPANPAASGRKRRSSPPMLEFLPCGDLPLGEMNECTAAMVLMSLSASPKSPRLSVTSGSWSDQMSVSSSGSDGSMLSEVAAHSSAGGGSHGDGSPASGGSGGCSSGSGVDEGIVMDDFCPEERKRPSGDTCVVYKCTWPKCRMVTSTCAAIERHVRSAHLGPVTSDQEEDLSDHEEEFYYTEMEVATSTRAPLNPAATVVAVAAHCGGGVLLNSPPPTLSHMDMARPPHEDPQYLHSRPQVAPPSIQLARSATTLSQQQQQQQANVVARLGWSSNQSVFYPQKYIRLGPKAFTTPAKMAVHGRRSRGDVKKCRKVYGMEHREQWCTQCKWKKACTRFSEIV